MVRYLKEDTTNSYTELNTFENNLKAIHKKLSDIVPLVGDTMLLVQSDNSDISSSLMKVYANCRRLLDLLETFCYDK